MDKINIDHFISFLSKSGKRSFKTFSRGKEFFVEVTPYGLCYIPKSSGKSRKHQIKYINRILDRFNQTGSFSPGDYIDLTVNASYTLSLIREYIKS